MLILTICSSCPTSQDGACKQLKHKRPGTKETEEHDSNQKRLKKNKQGAAGAKCKSPKQDVKSSKQNKVLKNQEFNISTVSASLQSASFYFE